MKESCIELTAPVDVPVVADAKTADIGTPKRTSLPSMAAPASWSAGPAWLTSAQTSSAVTAAQMEAIDGEDRVALPQVADHPAEGARAG